MGFLKRNVVLLISAIGVVGALTSLVFAFGYLGSVQAKLKASKDRGELVLKLLAGKKPRGSKEGPRVVNAQAVDAAKKYNEGVSDDAKRTQLAVTNINWTERKWLHTEVFPERSNDAAPFEFRIRYSQAFDPLLAKLRAADRPGREEVRYTAELLKMRMMPELDEMRGEDDDYGLFRRSARVAYQIPGLSGLATLMTAINVAQENQMYANYDSFQISGIANSTDMPTGGDMWDAQLGLWIQQDVVEGLANLNRAAAAKKGPGEELSIFDAPVKHLLEIQIEGYVKGAGGRGGGMGGAGMGRGGPPASMGGGGFGGRRGGGGGISTSSGGSFTNRASNDLFDVVRFSFSVVCDSRDICLLLKEMAKVNLFTQISMNIERVSGSTRGQAGQRYDYIYGDEPIVRVTLAYEAYFFSEYFRPYMPPEVRLQLVGGEAGGMPGGGGFGGGPGGAGMGGIPGAGR